MGKNIVGGNKMSRRLDMVVMFGYFCILLFGVVVKEIPYQFGIRN